MASINSQAALDSVISATGFQGCKQFASDPHPMVPLVVDSGPQYAGNCEFRRDNNAVTCEAAPFDPASSNTHYRRFCYCSGCPALHLTD